MVSILSSPPPPSMTGWQRKEWEKWVAQGYHDGRNGKPHSYPFTAQYKVANDAHLRGWLTGNRARRNSR